MYVVEIVSWNGKSGVTDQEMIEAVNAMIPDLEKLPGFRYQSLSKSKNDQWVEIYYWDTAEEAHRSNDLMADKASLGQLLLLIKLESLSIEVLSPFQESMPLQL